MTFRNRLLVTFLFSVLLPVIVLSFFIRGEMLTRFAQQYDERIESLITIIEEDVTQQSAGISRALTTITNSLADDNRFRRAVVDGDRDEREYLLDYASRAMNLTGLSMLQIQDKSGRIISSGHFRNEYDRLERSLPGALGSEDNGIALMEIRSPDGEFPALVRVDSISLGGRRFTIIAGLRVEDRFLDRLARESSMIVELEYPGGFLSSGTLETAELAGSDRSDAGPGPAAVVRDLVVPFLDSKTGRLTEASFRVIHPRTELALLMADIDRWFLIVVVATAVLSILLITWLSSRISRPLTDLAEKTSRIDLDRLNVNFSSNRKDEIGSLSRLLGSMTDRLRASAQKLRNAERVATRGELARQVNHDIKNGLTPIRNIFRHLSDVSSDDPGSLSHVFGERSATLDSSITYLEELASNYARMSPRAENIPCDVNSIVKRVVTDFRAEDRARIKLRTGPDRVVKGDPVSLRRILENLVSNALDSLNSGKGEVVVSTEFLPSQDHEERIRIIVADDGRGMTAEQQAHAFDDFYTTKKDGTGLGLSIVRRLVMDLNGSVNLESEEGRGSRFFIDLPTVGAAGSHLNS
jgi:signal transduction histidine kinase